MHIHEQGEFEHLEAWETVETRLHREAWRGATRKEAKRAQNAADHGSNPTGELVQRLAAAAVQKLQDQAQIRQLRREVSEMREMIMKLQVQHQQGVDATADAEFGAELRLLEAAQGSVAGESALDLDLGSILEEW